MSRGRLPIILCTLCGCEKITSLVSAAYPEEVSMALKISHGAIFATVKVAEMAKIRRFVLTHNNRDGIPIYEEVE